MESGDGTEREKMSQKPILDPAPFFLAGGPVGIVLVHGFTGSPTEMRLVGDYLHARGITVCAPCLPGHGTTVADLNRMRWQDWADHVDTVFDELCNRCDVVFVGGGSLGALLSLVLASRRPALAGAVLYSPAIIVFDRRTYLLPILKYVIRQMPKPADHFTDPHASARLWSYAAYPAGAAHEALKLIGQVKRLLPQVTCPLLVMQSTIDQAAHPDSARYICDRVSSTETQLVLLHNSGHVMTLDSEWESVAEHTYEFIASRLSQRK